ncbi:MAG TPA: GTP cyclohydrolase I [Gemmatimonadaceae bacterium]|nr:GTP cyclohydrolase I [Gemmatimonadaceae bacterium]
MGTSPQLVRTPVVPGAHGTKDHAARGRLEQRDAGEHQLLRTTAAFRAFLESLGLDPEDPILAGTDRRVARAYRELLAGLSEDAEPTLTVFPNTEGHSGIVQVTGLPFYSICAHHFLPFFGVAHVGYVPGDRLVGLSKLGRVVDYCARRPQLQEHLTEQIATYLDQRIAPRGVMVVLEGRHLCMEMRGLSRPNVMTTTTAVRGLLEDPRRQQQFYSQLRVTGSRTDPEDI